MKFVNRREELRILDDHLSRPGPALFVLYGRRRVGKTALLERVLDAREGAAYHVATQSTLIDELGRLSATLARAWQQPLLGIQPLTSTAALMAALESAPPGVLVIDELPYLIESDPALPGLLQASWDRRLSHGGLKLIVCGSSISMMESTFFSRRGPLFGRRTGQLRLGPLAPQHLAEIFPWRTVDVLELAALFGGVPGYLNRLDPQADLLTNLSNHLLRRGEPLYEEVPFLLREELREPRVYHAILAAIAAGATRFGEISSKIGLDRANLSRYLGVLAELGLVTREVPVTEPNPEKSRKGLYRIADPFVATWFALVHPNRDLIERGLIDEVLRERIMPALPGLLSRSVERVFVELLRGSALVAEIPFQPAYAGRYWSPTTELDVVLLDAERRAALVCELKWTRQPVGTELLDHLRARTAREPALAGMDRTYAIISRAGFTGRRRPGPDERLIDAGALELLEQSR